MEVNYHRVLQRVQCLQCKEISYDDSWERLELFEKYTPGGTEITANTAMICPECGSTAYKYLDEKSPDQSN